MAGFTADEIEDYARKWGGSPRHLSSEQATLKTAAVLTASQEIEALKNIFVAQAKFEHGVRVKYHQKTLIA